MSANKPDPSVNPAKGTSSGSDEDDETGPCEQSNDPNDKRNRRYIIIKTLNAK